MIEILHKKEDWDGLLRAIGTYDFYHTHEYHQALCKEGEQPVLISYASAHVKIAFPFIKRKVDDTYFDLTSVHGYLGPISAGIGPDFNNSDFMTRIGDLFYKENIVAAFSKLNPFIQGQDFILDSIGTIETIGELIYFDQGMDDLEQTSHYNRNTRQSLKKLRRSATVEEGRESKDIDSFIPIYHDTMDRLNANDLFYFPREYFQSLMESTLVDCKFLMAIHNETKEIMASAFVTHSGEICHLELMGTNEKYLNLSPSRILYDEARSQMKGDRIKYLVLGGGSGGREGSLMRFKSSFTQNYTDLRIWKHIAIPDVYDALQSESQRDSDSNFFPKYRIPI